jgi:hypothetical protein
MSRKLRPLAALAMIAVISAGCSANAPSETDIAGSVAGNTAAPAEVGSGGSGGNDTAAPAGTDTDSTAATPREQAVRFSECMRDNGVKGFPDPDASGELTIDGVLNGSSLDPDSAAWKKAIGACTALEPPGFTGHKRSAQEQQGALKFAQCIRDNGVKDFPDPTPDSPLIDTNQIPSMAGKDPRTDSALTAAMEKCGFLASAAGVTGVTGGQ